jgi:hypothetical protein
MEENMKNLSFIFAIALVICISPSFNGLLAQTGTESTITGLPSPKPGKGHATGIIIVKGEPYKNKVITLIRLIDGKIKPLPDIKTDVKGRWTALNLEPGKYLVYRFFVHGFTTGIIYSSDDVKEVKPGMVTDFKTKDMTTDKEKKEMNK